MSQFVISGVKCEYEEKLKECELKVRNVFQNESLLKLHRLMLWKSGKSTSIIKIYWSMGYTQFFEKTFKSLKPFRCKLFYVPPLFIVFTIS